VKSWVAKTLLEHRRPREGTIARRPSNAANLFIGRHVEPTLSLSRQRGSGTVACANEGRIRAVHNYLNNHWRQCSLITTGCRIPTDNSAAEQLMRPVATARRNSLLPGSPNIGNRRDTLLKLITTELRHGLDTSAYLKEALDAIPSRSTAYPLLRPGVWSSVTISSFGHTARKSGGTPTTASA
jgi:hypothetical protein